MEKNSNNNLKEDVVDKIYEIIRDKGFIQELWLDVLSDLRQKPSYKKLKSMVEKVIETSVKNYVTKPKDHEESVKRRKSFTDIGIMTYVVDTLLSDVLKKKLKDELFSMINRTLEDHNNRINFSNMDTKTKAVIMLEDIGKLLCNGKEDEHEEPHEGSSISPKLSERRLSEKTAAKHSTPKKGNKLNSMGNETSSLTNGSLNMTCCNIINSPLKSPSKRPKNDSKISNAISQDENSDVDVTKVSDDEEDNHSIRSVSSVHTSDLSSFEDDISISSEDEKGFKVKKHVPLKLAKDLYSSGRLSDLHKSHQKTEEQASPGPSVKHSMDSPSQRSSTRMRKPNSKYASDDVFCPLPLISSQNDSCVSEKEVKEEIVSKNGSEMQQSSSSKNSVKSPGKSLEKLKSCLNKKNSVEESESSDESDSSLPSIEDVFKKEKQLVKKRGRPKKDKPLTEQTSPAIKEIRKETKVKRGRPSKSNEETVPNKRQCVLDEMLPNLEKKLHYQTDATQLIVQNASQLNDINSDNEIKRKRGRPSKISSVIQMADEPNQHSVESFSQLEERLCVKDKSSESSPSKSSKSYETSDLYKPRSDFRSFNSGRGSKALTLFSN